MYQIPEQWRDIPEGKRVQAAEDAWSAIKQKLRLGLTPELQDRMTEARRELEAAQLALDALMGEPKSAGITQAVFDQVRIDFREDQADEVIEILDTECGRNLPFMREVDATALDQIRLAVLKLAQGDTDKLRQMIDAAKLDQRDVLMTAYYTDHPLED